MSALSPEPILRHVYGYWASSILATSLRCDLFSYLQSSPSTVAELATRASISPRSTQALLDALLGMGLVEKAGPDSYRNTLLASAYLVKGQPEYLGGYAGMILSTWRDWEKLPDVVASGKPLHRQEDPNPHNPFWEDLVRALAPLSFPPARAAAKSLGIADRQVFDFLDIAGGAGGYSAIWLGLNPKARSVQLDWPNVNAIARSYVTSFGVADRLRTIDGDMETTDLGESLYDCVIYSNIAHGISSARNTAMFRKIKRALKPGGSLMIVGLVPSEERTGSPLLMMFNVNLMLNSEEGGTHVGSEYAAWLREADFSTVQFEGVEELPFTLIFAA
ncbi:MAG TPA: methyltransferase dimerization domain-containing protein [Polyangiales bacterium]|nr:methyltransferase dimerization domain-containing protein [Polyangiales bacterium]